MVLTKITNTLKAKPILTVIGKSCSHGHEVNLTLANKPVSINSPTG